VTAASAKDLGLHRPSGAKLAVFERTRRKNLRQYGTLTRYRTVMTDGTEREVVHGQSLTRRKAATRAVELTIGTAPPLSLGPEGMVMHFLLKSMEMGIDGLVFGPERSQSDIPRRSPRVREIASRVSFIESARASHLIANRLSAETSADLRHMLWAGLSLGAMKGITFAAMAPEWKRTMVYAHFVVPVCPEPMPAPTSMELRRFQRTEMGAMMRLSYELMWHDMRDRNFGVHPNVLRVYRPGLAMRYAQSTPRDSVFQIFTEAWRDEVISGVVGVAASTLPTDRLTTFELFDKDEGGRPDAWQRKLRRQLAAGTTRLVVKRGRHTDALRLSHQRGRARAMYRVVRAVRAGTPVEELTHPIAR
jgi:hypothetical protein